MRKFRLLLGLVSLLLVAAFSAFHVSYYFSTSGPIINVPLDLDLGTQRTGNLITTSIPIRNLGRDELILNDFLASCGCVSFEVKNAETAAKVERVVLPAHAEVELVLRIATRGAPGSRLRELIRFRSNDPQRPVIALELNMRLIGGIVAVPTEIQCSQISVTEVAKRRILLYDTGVNEPFVVHKVVSSRPEVIKITGVTQLRPEQRSEPLEFSDGIALYAVDIQIESSSPISRMEEVIQVIPKGPGVPAIRIPVVGSIDGRFRVAPVAVVLPRMSEEGPIYSTICRVSSSDGKAFVLRPISVPEGIDVSFQKETTDGSISLTVGCAPSFSSGNGRPKITLEATMGDVRELIDIPFLIRTHRN
jgi:hypothetical protein